MTKEYFYQVMESALKERGFVIERRQDKGRDFLQSRWALGNNVRVEYLEQAGVTEVEISIILATTLEQENVVSACVLSACIQRFFTVEGKRVFYRRRFALTEPVDTEYFIRALDRMRAVMDWYVWYFAKNDVTARPIQPMPENLPPTGNPSGNLRAVDSENFVGIGEIFEQTGYHVEAQDGRFTATPDGGFPYMVYLEPELEQLRICYRLGRIPRHKRAAACVLRCALQREMEGPYLQFEVDEGTLELCYELPYYTKFEKEFVLLALKRLFLQRRQTTYYFNRLNDGCSLGELLEELGGLG